MIFVNEALLVRSVLDKGVVSWYDALNDHVTLNDQDINMFGLIVGRDISCTRSVSV